MTTRCVFNLKTGSYCDREDSFVNGPPSDRTWIEGGNVMGRFGGGLDDYAIVNVSDSYPELCLLVDGKAVRDAALESADASSWAIVQSKVTRLAEIKAKAASGTATLAELNEFVAAQ